MIWPAGSEILCARCRSLLYITARELMRGDPLTAQAFRTPDGSATVVGQVIECPIHGKLRFAECLIVSPDGDEAPVQREPVR
jgi:hypothetical protein